MTPFVRRVAPGAAILAAVSALALAVGAFYCAAYERRHPAPEPWTRELGAAISFACGRGFVDPGYAPSPAIAAFLDKRIDRVACTDLPADAPARPPNFTQRLYRYLTLAVGVTWRLFGISWTRLAVLLGVLYAATAAAAYGLFRLAAPRGAAALGACIMIASPLQLRYLPELRDYAKAPFLLALILILALLVLRPFSPRRLVALAVCYGAVTGIGFGFRNDLLVAALPFAVTVLAFLPAPLRAHPAPKLAALAACALAFTIAAWPIIAAYSSGSNSGHVALLGLMTHFDRPLGVSRSVYDWGAPYDDGFAVKVITSFTDRVHHQSVTPLSPEYDRAMFEYLLLIARHWPADLLVRAYAAVLRVLELPFQIRLYTTAAPPAIDDGLAARGYELWVGALSRLAGVGTVASLLAIAAAAGASVRVGIWLALSLLYFGGYPAVQFDARHFFFLEIVPWLAIVSVCAGALRLIRGRAPIAIEAPLRAAAFGVSLLVVVAGGVIGLRAYQQRHVAALIDGYVAAPTEALTLSHEPERGARTLLEPAELRRATEPAVRAEYLVADVSRRRCADDVVAVTVRYVTQPGYTDLSQRFDVPVPRSDAPARLFFPVYYSPGGYFAGIELSDADAGCVAGLRRVTDLDRTPILLNLTLPPDWRDLKLYQTLTPRRLRIWNRG